MAIPPPQTRFGECWSHWKSHSISEPLFDTSKNESYQDFYRRIGRQSCWKEWLVVVYMAADNDLSPYSWRDLWEMESVGSTNSVDVVVFNDNAQVNGTRYIHIAKGETPEFYSVESPEEELRFLESKGAQLSVSPDAKKPMPEGDSGSIVTAGKFLRWALKKYPSRRVLLIGWSHSEGFDAPITPLGLQSLSFIRTTKGVGRKGGFALDLKPSIKGGKATHMAVTEMAAGVGRISDELRGGKLIDIVGSDACLNQQVEFGYEWLGRASYVFGSSSIVQKKGFNYRTLLHYLNDHAETETSVIAAEIPKIYGRAVGGRGSEKYSSYFDPFATMAVWETNRLLYLKRALDDLGSLLSDWVKDNDRLVELRDEVIASSHRFGGISTDLHNLLQTLEEWAIKRGLSDILSEVRLTSLRLSDSVLSSYIGEKYLQKTGGGALIPTSKGVSVWLPTTETELKEMMPKLAQSKLYQEERSELLGAWARFVSSLY